MSFRSGLFLEQIDDASGTNPGLGAEWTLTPPSGEAWEILAIRVRFVTGVTVASRQVRLRINGPTVSDVIRISAARIQLASNDIVYQFARLGMAPYDDGFGSQMCPFPERIVLYNSSVDSVTMQSDTNNIQVTDDYDAPRALIRRLNNYPIPS